MSPFPAIFDRKFVPPPLDERRVVGGYYRTGGRNSAFPRRAGLKKRRIVSVRWRSSCGCATAEQCWRVVLLPHAGRTVCLGRDHGVRPPSNAIAAARQSGIDLAWLDGRAGEYANQSNICCHKNTALTRSRTSLLLCSRTRPRSESPDKQPHRGLCVLNCRGQSLNWLTAVPTLIVDRPALSHPAPLIIWLGPASSERIERLTEHPPVPPPEGA